MSYDPPAKLTEHPLYHLTMSAEEAAFSFAELERALGRFGYVRDIPPPRPTPVRALRERAGRA